MTETKKNFNYRPQYGAVVMCKDEKSQQDVFERLKSQGFDKLKIVCV